MSCSFRQLGFQLLQHILEAFSKIGFYSHLEFRFPPFQKGFGWSPRAAGFIANGRGFYFFFCMREGSILDRDSGNQADIFS